MALRVKCRCGKSLLISPELAGKKLACPACRHPFRIPAERFKDIQSRQRAAPAVETARAARGAAAPSPSGVTRTAAPPPLDFEPANLDLEIEREASQSHLRIELEEPQAGAPAPGSGAAAAKDDATELPYAGAPTKRLPGRRVALDAVSGPQRGFWTDALFCTVYPFANLNNAVVFCILGATAVISVFLRGLGGFALAGCFIIYGWIAGVFLSIVQETAAGSDDLPGIKMEDGFFEDIIVPAFKYTGAYAVSLLPAIVFGLGLALGFVPESAALLLPLWFVGGIFMFPIIMILFAFGALAMLVRVDLMLATIFRTFLPYLALWALLLLSQSLFFATRFAGVFMLAGLDLSPLKGLLVGFTANAVLAVVDVCLTIVAMRLIGLYYLHFKHRFALVFE